VSNHSHQILSEFFTIKSRIIIKWCCIISLDLRIVLLEIAMRGSKMVTKGRKQIV
jgi:hypothetical protein